MRARRSVKTGIDFKEFTDPYSGIAAMVFVQAVSDLDMLKGKESAFKDSIVISRNEISNFFWSDWAEVLADALNIDIRTVRAFGV